VPVVKCKSKNNNIYYKCSNRCGKFWFDDAYELYLRDNHANLLKGSGHIPIGGVEVVPAASVVQGFQQPFASLKMVELDLKLQLGDIKMEIGNLKTEMKALKDEVKIEMKHAAAAILILAMFVAVLVAIVWKKKIQVI
jgi:hypothetical protein